MNCCIGTTQVVLKSVLSPGTLVTCTDYQACESASLAKNVVEAKDCYLIFVPKHLL